MIAAMDNRLAFDFNVILDGNHFNIILAGQHPRNGIDIIQQKNRSPRIPAISSRLAIIIESTETSRFLRCNFSTMLLGF